MELFRDGEATYYLIQQHSSGRGWVTVNPGSYLFADRSFDWKRGPEADHLRSLLKPRGANSALWQRYGISGFERFQDVVPVARAMAAARPKDHLRVVRRTTIQRTEVVEIPGAEVAAVEARFAPGTEAKPSTDLPSVADGDKPMEWNC